MIRHLCVRSYTLKMSRHSHPFHQVVLPLAGSIDIRMDGYAGSVSAGELIVIRSGACHEFRAQEAAKFIVVDLDNLPEALNHTQVKLYISEALNAYLTFIEQQLLEAVNPALDKSVRELLWLLLHEQTGHRLCDARIEQAVAHIHTDLSASHTVRSLAAVACLSPTQFKKRFHQAMQCTTQQYLIRARMERAEALLRYSDLPVTLIAEQVGYQDVSAFSRRFREVSGHPPTWCRK